MFEVKPLKSPEEDNTRLKKLHAEAMPDKEVPGQISAASAPQTTVRRTAVRR